MWNSSCRILTVGPASTPSKPNRDPRHTFSFHAGAARATVGSYEIQTLALVGATTLGELPGPACRRSLDRRGAALAIRTRSPPGPFGARARWGHSCHQHFLRAEGIGFPRSCITCNRTTTQFQEGAPCPSSKRPAILSTDGFSHVDFFKVYGPGLQASLLGFPEHGYA